jgi:hypothetical protein
MLFRNADGVEIELSEDHASLAERNGFALVEEAEEKPKKTTKKAAE